MRIECQAAVCPALVPARRSKLRCWGSRAACAAQPSLRATRDALGATPSGEPSGTKTVEQQLLYRHHHGAQCLVESQSRCTTATYVSDRSGVERFGRERATAVAIWAGEQHGCGVACLSACGGKRQGRTVCTTGREPPPWVQVLCSTQVRPCRLPPPAGRHATSHSCCSPALHATAVALPCLNHSTPERSEAPLCSLKRIVRSYHASCLALPHTCGTGMTTPYEAQHILDHIHDITYCFIAL